MLTIMCSWCQCEIRRDDPPCFREVSEVSHGICPECQDKVLREEFPLSWFELDIGEVVA
jgi:hypothetical protein